MSLRFSTGLTTGVLLTGSVKSLLEGAAGFHIDIYSGTRPTTPDAVPTGTLLVTVGSGAGGTTGAHFDTALGADGGLQKLASETWTGTVANAGTAGWFRIRQKTADTNGVSTTLPRVDGVIAPSGGDMALDVTALAASSVFTIGSISLALLKEV